jgi:hypothetical protein
VLRRQSIFVPVLVAAFLSAVARPDFSQQQGKGNEQEDALTVAVLDFQVAEAVAGTSGAVAEPCSATRS